jgi:hypothetical protein
MNIILFIYKQSSFHKRFDFQQNLQSESKLVWLRYPWIMVFNATLNNISATVFPKVNWSWMDIRSTKGVRITGPSIKFKGHSHTPQRGCSDLYWSFGPVMNNLLLDQTIFYRTLPHVWWTLGITKVISLRWDLLVEENGVPRENH